MKKEDFNLDGILNEESIKASLNIANEAYLICFTKDDDYIISEIHEGEYYLGGDGFEFVNDSNIGFDSIEQVEDYYKRKYKGYIVFTDEYDRDEFLELNNLEL